MRVHRVLVCGTNYGRAYVNAIRSMPGRCELVGLLARGSDRSLKLASELSVPLYDDPERLPTDLDVACVAIPSTEKELIPQLVKRGIHVLSDHPQRARTLEAALRLARDREVCFHVNGHFSQLDAPRRFAQTCTNFRESVEPVFIDVLTTDRFLYGALDILRFGLGTFEPFRFSSSSSISPLVVVQGVLAGLACTVQIQVAGDSSGTTLRDGSPDYLADIRLAVGFPMGILTLLSLGGPVYWNWNYNRTRLMDDPLTTSVFQDPFSPAQLREQRSKANQVAIRQLLDCSREGIVPEEQRPEHVLQVSRVWEAVGRNC